MFCVEESLKWAAVRRLGPKQLKITGEIISTLHLRSNLDRQQTYTKHNAIAISLALGPDTLHHGSDPIPSFFELS